jgi:hypothetical protein
MKNIILSQYGKLQTSQNTVGYFLNDSFSKFDLDKAIIFLLKMTSITKGNKVLRYDFEK